MPDTLPFHRPYHRELSAAPPLSLEIERRLFAQFHAARDEADELDHAGRHDEAEQRRREAIEARNTIVRHTLRAAVLIVRRRIPPKDRDDAMGLAHVVLMRAADSFDPSHGVKFLTYFWTALQRAMTDFVRRRKPLATMTDDIPEPESRELPAFECAARADDAAEARDALALLTERERLVIGLHFGLDGHDETTLAEIAGRLGVSKARVGQIELGALNTMRRALCALEA